MIFWALGLSGALQEFWGLCHNPSVEGLGSAVSDPAHCTFLALLGVLLFPEIADLIVSFAHEKPLVRGRALHLWGEGRWEEMWAGFSAEGEQGGFVFVLALCDLCHRCLLFAVTIPLLWG